MKFFALASQVGIDETFDGIVGFGRQYTYTDGSTQGPLFLEEAKTAGTISNEIIAFYLSGETGINLVDIGNYVTGNIKDSDANNIVWFPMPDKHLFWYGDALEAVQIGNSETTKSGKTAAYSYKGWEFPVIFDSGTSLIYAPAGLGREINLRLAKGNSYLHDSQSGMTIVDCSEKEQYEDVFLTIDGHKFQVSVDDYFIVLKAKDGGEDTCILAFVDFPSASFWLLGDAFLRGYYSIHDNTDHNSARIGFAPHSTSSKQKVQVGVSIPENSVE
jgi:hypothetical protein